MGPFAIFGCVMGPFGPVLGDLGTSWWRRDVSWRSLGPSWADFGCPVAGQLSTKVGETAALRSILPPLPPLSSSIPFYKSFYNDNFNVFRYCLSFFVFFFDILGMCWGCSGMSLG